MLETALQLVSQYGDLALFFLLVFGIIGLPIPDETLLTFAGYLIFKGHLHFPTTLAAAFAGSVCGITGSYLIGRTGGLYVIHKYGRYVHITPERLDYVHAWFERVGRWGLFFGYFIPGIRHFTAIIAGHVSAGVSRLRAVCIHRRPGVGVDVSDARIFSGRGMVAPRWTDSALGRRDRDGCRSPGADWLRNSLLAETAR